MTCENLLKVGFRMFHNGRITMRPYDNHDLSWISFENLLLIADSSFARPLKHEAEGLAGRARLVDRAGKVKLAFRAVERK
jgi:hypothetical protein